MYTLYYLPGACSLATHTVLQELGLPADIIDAQKVDNFASINPVGSVPVLMDQTRTLREGAAIMLHLLTTHQNALLPEKGQSRDLAIQNIMFANATMHPAYGRLFFIAQNISDEKTKQLAFKAAAESITHLWQVVEQQLKQQSFLGGDQPSAADIMLAVYHRWGGDFPVEIKTGPKTQKMVAAVTSMPSFQRALDAEQRQSAA